MRISETVTFGGDARIDRAGEMRGNNVAIAAALADKPARAVVVWRGKLLVRGEDDLKLGLVATDAKLLNLADEAPTFLGLDDGAARFAYDISGWEPEDIPDTTGALFDPSEITHPDMPDNYRFAEIRMIMTRLSPADAELAATAKAILGWHEIHGFCARCGEKTKVAMAGWQRDCPACGGHHFPRTDPVVIMLITRGNKLLLGRSPGWPEGMYSLLAGFIEPGETVEAAVRREVYEESGIKVGDVGYLASQPWPFPSSLMIGCWGTAVSEEITVDPHEIEEAFWISKEDLIDVFAGRNEKILPARKGAIAQFLMQNWLADKLD